MKVTPEKKPDTRRKKKAPEKPSIASLRKATPERRAALLTALVTTGGNISRACKAVDITRMTAYRWVDEDPAFAKEWERAKAWGAEELEDEMRRRAFEGSDRPVFHLGVQCGTIREYSDTLGIFLLKGAMPDKYRERAEIKHGVTGDLSEAMSEARERAKAQ